MERVHSDPAVLWLQVNHANKLISVAKRGNFLLGVEEIVDPSDELIEVHLAVLWYAAQVLWSHSTRPGKAARFGRRTFRAC